MISLKTGAELEDELIKAREWIEANPDFDSTYAVKNIKILQANNENVVSRLRIEMSPDYTVWTAGLYKQTRKNEKTFGFRTTVQKDCAKVSSP